MNALTLGRRISDAVDEYDAKYAAIAEVVKAFTVAGEAVKSASTIGGTYGNTNIDVGHLSDHSLQASLLKSAWKHVFDGLNIKLIASAKDKNRFAQTLENPPPFTLQNIRATFGHYIQDPRGNILRGLAEVFADLDPAYKSHERVKIGVRGLPKRVILTNVSDYGWGRDRLQNVLNAIACYQRKPLVEWEELSSLLKDQYALRETRGVWLRRFSNGNGHLYFDADTLRDVNMALAEYYGEVLADAAEYDVKPRPSTEVSKNLQYYPTPAAVVDKLLDELWLKGQRVLEPSCGCGRFLDGLRDRGVECFGIEYDGARAAEARAKGHNVLQANFLQVEPPAELYDRVIMNPPFYGRHYFAHVQHALKFLKPGGTLTAILPATARYDHGLLTGRDWYDMPVGSFSESGTNVATTIHTIHKPEAA